MNGSKLALWGALLPAVTHAIHDTIKDFQTRHVKHGHFGDDEDHDAHLVDTLKRPELERLDAEGFNMFHHACAAGELKVVKKILKKHVDVNLRAGKSIIGSGAHGETGLALAANKGHWGIVTLLAAHGADVDLSNPLIFAASNGHTDTITHLLDAGAHVDAAGANPTKPTALFAASLIGHSRAVEMLLKAGANPHVTDGEGSTMLKMATKWAKKFGEDEEFRSTIDETGGGDYKWVLYHLRQAVSQAQKVVPPKQDL